MCGVVGLRDGCCTQHVQHAHCLRMVAPGFTVGAAVGASVSAGVGGGEGGEKEATPISLRTGREVASENMGGAGAGGGPGGWLQAGCSSRTSRTARIGVVLNIIAWCMVELNDGGIIRGLPCTTTRRAWTVSPAQLETVAAPKSKALSQTDETGVDGLSILPKHAGDAKVSVSPAHDARLRLPSCGYLCT